MERRFNMAVRQAASLVALSVMIGPQASAAQADRFIQIPPDPDMPRVDGFDTERALLWAEPNFVPFRQMEWVPMRAARRSNAVAADTPVLAFEAGGKMLVLVTAQMSYHHVAQGEMAGEPWMVTF